MMYIMRDRVINTLFQLFFISTLFIVGCGQASKARIEDETFTTQAKAGNAVKFRLETVTGGLEVPWAFAFLPGERILVTERPGRVRMIEKGKLRPEPVFIVPDVEPSSESGLMDITLHPNFASNNFIYLAYAYNQDGKRVKVVRYKFAGDKFTEPKVILEGVPGAPNHAGMRCDFGPDGKLYISAGDSTDWQLAQKLDSFAGKILRVNDDGTIPPDNPFIDQKNVRPEIWAYGVRNPQGLAWQPGSSLLFETEHGPSGFDGPGGGDEVNIIEKGKNYGWPVIHHKDSKEGMESPLLEYTPAIAPASAMFYRGAVFPDFKGNFFFGNLRGETIIRVILNGRNVVAQERLLEDKLGRIREIAEGPDGFIYFSTSNRDGRGSAAEPDDRVMRIVPAK
jgi:glucose/arabinose dehydrogenase